MSSSSPDGDLILLVPTPSTLEFQHAKIEQAAERLRSRISCDAVCLGTQTADAENPTRLQNLGCLDARKSRGRIVLIPCGSEALTLAEIRSAWWFGQLPKCRSIHLADPWSAREIGQWIGNSALAWRQDPSEPIALSLVRGTPDGPQRSEQQIEALVLIAFWANRIRADAVSLTATDPQPIDFDRLDADELATWMLQRYLRAVKSRPIPWNPQSDSDWPALYALHNELQKNLPSEYAERLDQVAPQSMGSAKIAPDRTGKVPWDKIWTSFCDLAMAGGPPHRGKLLEPVKIEDIEKSPDAYAIVVAEIRRGIQLASELETSDSPYLGWVQVDCDDEPMAAWLLRAILVENISARREAHRLYLPAGPDYRIEKEIKNVITAVAKTTHYWRAHLRSRQPPNPL